MYIYIYIIHIHICTFMHIYIFRSVMVFLVCNHFKVFKVQKSDLLEKLSQSGVRSPRGQFRYRPEASPHDKTIFPKSWNIMESRKRRSKYLSINFLAGKSPYFPSPESSKQDLVSKQ